MATSVGRLGGGILGAVVGSFFGPLGASVGYSLGSVGGGLLGQAIEGPEQFRNEGSIPSDITFTGSTQGSVLKVVYGTAKVAGNIIHFRQRNRRITTKTRSGGKGFGGGAVTTNVSYEKTVDVCIAFCEGETDLVEIWLNGNREYSQITGTQPQNLGNWRWYRGTETQQPDSSLQAIFGVDRVPAYRGVAYLVITDWNLSAYGNQLPNVRVLVSNNISRVLSWDAVPAETKTPPGYTRNTNHTIRNARDGSGFYTILEKDGGFHLGKWSHALRDWEFIGARWILPSPVGFFVNDILLQEQLITSGNFQYYTGNTGYAFDVDDRYVYIICDLVNTNVTDVISDYLIAIDYRTGSGIVAVDTTLSKSKLVDVGKSAGAEFPAQATPIPIQGTRIIWVSNRIDQESDYQGRNALNPNSVMAFALGDGTFQLVKHWSATEIVSPIVYYLRDVTGVMDPEFDEENLSWHYYRLLFGNDKNSAARVKYSIKFPFYPVGPVADPGNNPNASISTTQIANFGAFEWFDNQYANHIIFDVATKNALVHIRWNELNFPNTRETFKLIDLEASRYLGGITGTELSALPNYEPLNGFSNMVASDAVYDPNGYFWIYDNNFADSVAIKINTTDIRDITYYEPSDWDSGVILYGRISYDWRTNAFYSHNEGDANQDRYLKIGRVETGAADIKAIVDDVLINRAGLKANQIDTLELQGLEGLPQLGSLDGYIIAKPTNAKQVLEPLAQAFGFYWIESEGKLKFRLKWNRTALATYTPDFGASEGQLDAIIDETVKQITGTPSSVTLNYLDPDFDYQQASQRSNRRILPNENNVVVDGPLVISSRTARIITDRLLFEENQFRRNITFQVPIIGETGVEYLKLEPGDVILIDYQDELVNQADELFEVVEMRVAGLLLTIIARSFESSFYNPSTAVAYAPNSGITLSALSTPVLYPPDWLFIDSPALRRADVGPGWYAVADNLNNVTEFRGAQAFRLENGDFESVQIHDISGDIGRTTEFLPDYPWMNWDEANSITVQLNDHSDSFPSYTESQVLEGNGAILVGTEDSNWELIQYQTAQDLGDGKWLLTSLLRNRRGTRDCYTQQGHPAYSKVVRVPLQNAGIFRIEENSTYINQEIEYRIVGAGFQVGNSPREFHTWTGASSKPRSPSSLQARRTNSNLIISWIRNDRIYDGWRDYIDLPNVEEVEQYEVTISDGVTTTTESTNGSTVTVPDIYTGVVNISVKQISVDVGAGYPAEITV